MDIFVNGMFITMDDPDMRAVGTLKQLEDGKKYYAKHPEADITPMLELFPGYMFCDFCGNNSDHHKRSCGGCEYLPGGRENNWVPIGGYAVKLNDCFDNPNKPIKGTVKIIEKEVPALDSGSLPTSCKISGRSSNNRRQQ